jgi:catechol 2,3-dioxygenase
MTSRHESPGHTRLRPRRLTHVNLYVGDLAANVTFYREVCGLDLLFEEPGVDAAFLGNGNSHHDLALMQASEKEMVGRDGAVQVEAARGTVPGLNHLAFEMVNERELVEAIEGAPDNGLKIERTLDHLISRSAYLYDPDDVWLEFYADCTKDWRGVYATMHGELISARWEPDATTASEVANFDDEAKFTKLADAALATRRTARAAIVVSDLSRSVAFYSNKLGLATLARSNSQGFAIMSGTLLLGDLLLLQQRSESESLGLHHFGLEVADAATLERGVQTLTERGVEVIERVSTSSVTALVVKDPDGRLVEFFVRGTRDPWTVAPGDDVERMYLL